MFLHFIEIGAVIIVGIYDILCNRFPFFFGACSDAKQTQNDSHKFLLCLNDAPPVIFHAITSTHGNRKQVLQVKPCPARKKKSVSQDLESTRPYIVHMLAHSIQLMYNWMWSYLYTVISTSYVSRSSHELNAAMT